MRTLTVGAIFGAIVSRSDYSRVSQGLVSARAYERSNHQETISWQLTGLEDEGL